MTPLEQIDLIFFYLKERITIGGSRGYNNIWNYVEATNDTGINRTMFREILKRLVDDSFITETILSDAQAVYHLTFAGLLFNSYLTAHELSQNENTRLQILAAQNLIVAKIVKKLTFWIMLGTLVAALYYILEILNNWISIYTKR